MIRRKLKKSQFSVKTLNGVVKKKEEERISCENLNLAHKLIKMQSILDRKRMKEEYRYHIVQRKRLQKINRSTSSLTLIPANKKLLNKSMKHIPINDLSINIIPRIIIRKNIDK